MQLSSRPACITCEAGPPAGFHAYPDVYGGQVDMVLLARPRTAMGLTACARRDPCGRAATVGSIQFVFMEQALVKRLLEQALQALEQPCFWPMA